MIKQVCSAMFGVAVIAAAGSISANAADEIEGKVQVCGACHGQNGTPTDPKTMPIIWGQTTYYIVKQLHDYRNGERNNPLMASIAKGLQLQDLRPIAAYFNSKTWPAKQAGSAPPTTPPEGIAQCQACHQQNFQGGAPAPRLAGLSYEYLSAAMTAFADGTRTNNGDMPQIMKALSPAQRDAMAHYIAGL
jgi:cytochrome c553